MKYLLSFLIWNLISNCFAEEQAVVVTHPSNNVDKIDKIQAAQIFLRQVQTWPDGRNIQPIDIKDGSPLRNKFYSKITGRSPGQLRAYWARQAFTGMGVPPKEVSNTAEVKEFVAHTPGAIGYIEKNETTEPLKILLDTEE